LPNDGLSLGLSKRRPPKMHKKMLVALDGSPGSLRALEEALDLATRYEADFHTICVEELPRYPGVVGEVVEEKEPANGRLGELVARARELGSEKGVRAHCHVIVGDEVRSVAEFIKVNGTDLLVVGLMGHSALSDRVMGSTCQSLVRLAPCSVLGVK